MTLKQIVKKSILSFRMKRYSNNLSLHVDSNYNKLLKKKNRKYNCKDFIFYLP